MYVTIPKNKQPSKSPVFIYKPQNSFSTKLQSLPAIKHLKPIKYQVKSTSNPNLDYNMWVFQKLESSGTLNLTTYVALHISSIKAYETMSRRDLLHFQINGV